MRVMRPQFAWDSLSERRSPPALTRSQAIPDLLTGGGESGSDSAAVGAVEHAREAVVLALVSPQTMGTTGKLGETPYVNVEPVT